MSRAKMAKCSLPSNSPSTSTAKHCKSGINRKWRVDFPWLEVRERDGGTCMLHVCGVESITADQRKLEVEKLLGLIHHVQA